VSGAVELRALNAAIKQPRPQNALTTAACHRNRLFVSEILLSLSHVVFGCEDVEFCPTKRTSFGFVLISFVRSVMLQTLNDTSRMEVISTALATPGECLTAFLHFILTDGTDVVLSIFFEFLST
jgi:hypothetical protein